MTRYDEIALDMVMAPRTHLPIADGPLAFAIVATLLVAAMTLHERWMDVSMGTPVHERSKGILSFPLATAAACLCAAYVIGPSPAYRMQEGRYAAACGAVERRIGEGAISNLDPVRAWAVAERCSIAIPAASVAS